MKRSIAKGTPEQFLNSVQNRIAELGGDIEACDKITASSETKGWWNKYYNLVDIETAADHFGCSVDDLREWSQYEGCQAENLGYLIVKDEYVDAIGEDYEAVDLVKEGDYVFPGMYTTGRLYDVSDEIKERIGGDVEACDKITASSETTYQDTNGIMGEIGDTWTVSELRQYWDAEQMNDPVLSEYDSFESWLEDTTSQMTLIYEEDDGHAVLAAKDSADINNAKMKLQQAVSDITDGQSLQSIANELSGLLRSSIEEFKIAYEDNDNASTENISVQRIYANKAAKVMQIYEDLIKSFKKPNNFYQSCSAIAAAIRKIAENFELDSLSSINDYGPMMRELDKLESADKIQKKLKLDLFNQYYKSLVSLLTNDLNMFKKKPKESLFSSTTIKANVEDSTYDDRFLHTLMGDIESEVSGEVDGLTFDTLENALNVTVVHGGEVTQFTVPHEDLSFDFDTLSDDVAYVVDTIRESLDSFSSADNVSSATNTCGIACKPEVLSSVNGDVIHGLTWSGLIQELSERGYEVDSAYRSSPDEHIVAYKDGKSYDIEVTQYSEGDYEIVLDNISEIIEADADAYDIQAASKLKQDFVCKDCGSELTRDELNKAMWRGTPYYICPCCEHPITRISRSELAEGEEIEYEIYSGTDVYENDDISDYSLVGFLEMATKSVPDSNGFYTDYTMYFDSNTGEYVFVFGDKDIYSPADGNFDWECETEEAAWEWFNSYEGFVDDDEEDPEYKFGEY